MTVPSPPTSDPRRPQSPPTQLQPNDYSLSRRGSDSLRRAAISVCDHERKAFAVVMLAANGVPFRHPSHLSHIFQEGKAPGSHVIVPTHDPRIFLVCGPVSSLPLLQTAYNRTHASTHATGCTLMPSATILPTDDPLSICSTPTSRQTLLSNLRSEICRLEAPEIGWRPARYFAASLRDLDNALFDMHNQDPDCSAARLPPPSLADGAGDITDEEIAPPPKLARRTVA